MANGDDGADHVARVHAQWRRELPDVELEGAQILARAGRITLMARGPTEAMFSRYGLQAGEYYVLTALRRAGPPYALRPTELYQSLIISSGGLTDRLRRLEEQGLIRRRPSDEDKRSMLVELTAEGRRRVERAFGEEMEIENALVSVLDKSEREQLATLLAKLARGMETAEPLPSSGG